MFHFDWIKRHAERTPHKLAVIDTSTGRQITYGDWERRITRLANFMRSELGLVQGDRVSILAQNSSDYYEVLFACAKLGVILNTLNWRLTAPELEYILNDCRPKTLFYDPDFAGNVAALRDGISAESFIVMGDNAPDGEWTYAAAVAAGSPNRYHHRA